MLRRRCLHGINAMILMPQFFDVIANENARYKRYESEYHTTHQAKNNSVEPAMMYRNGIGRSVGKSFFF